MRSFLCILAFVRLCMFVCVKTNLRMHVSIFMQVYLSARSCIHAWAGWCVPARLSVRAVDLYVWWGICRGRWGGKAGWRRWQPPPLRSRHGPLPKCSTWLWGLERRVVGWRGHDKRRSLCNDQKTGVKTRERDGENERESVNKDQQKVRRRQWGNRGERERQAEIESRDGGGEINIVGNWRQMMKGGRNRERQGIMGWGTEREKEKRKNRGVETSCQYKIPRHSKPSEDKGKDLKKKSQAKKTPQKTNSSRCITPPLKTVDDATAFCGVNQPGPSHL